MKPFLWKFLSGTGLCVTLLAPNAQAANEYSLENIDITPVVKYYSSQIVTLKKSVTVYNWGHHGPNPYWKTEPKQGAPALLKMAKNETHSFWDNYGNANGGGNSYGYGLYAAADPVLTYSYGGGDGNDDVPADWLLTEMQLPVGFKLLDVGMPGAYNGQYHYPPEEVKAILEKFECASQDLPELFQNGGLLVGEHCRKLVKEIFSHDLKMDGLAYMYGTTHFKDCADDPSWKAVRAFVITNGDWMTAKNLKFFTNLSSSELEDRIRIQTLFLKSTEDEFSASMIPTNDQVSGEIAEMLTNFPDSFVTGSTTTCSGAYCVITVDFCDANNQCQKMSLPPLPRRGGALITQEEIEGGYASRKLLWPDMEGKPKSTDISIWLKNNKYGCSGELPFDIPATPTPSPTPAP